jgi:hypothetical protein
MQYICAYGRVKMKHPKCSNVSCKHNDKYLCKAKYLVEDIICKKGKADALKNNNWSTSDLFSSDSHFKSETRNFP